MNNTKTIRVIKIDGEYIAKSSYSQGEFSYRTTDDVLKADNISEHSDYGTFVRECSESRGGVVEEYEVTIKRIR